MKTIIFLILFALGLTGCASPDYVQYAKSAEASNVARSKALSDIAASGDSGAKVAAVMALALGSGNSTLTAPQPNAALQWASILVPGLTQVAGMRYSYLSQQTASNNATALGVSTNGTFAGLAGKIQAPGAITTTTLSGTGNLGSGRYGTTDRHDVLNTAPVITPVVQVVPTVIEPTVITPVVQVIPVVSNQ